MFCVNRSGCGIHPIRDPSKISTKTRVGTPTVRRGSSTHAGLDLRLPAGFEAFVGGALCPLKGKEVQNWLDGIIIYTQQVEGHLNLLRQVLEKLSRAGLSVNLSKSWWCCPQQEFVGMVVDRLGVRPTKSKIDAVAQLTRADTVEEVRALLGMTGFLRNFVPRYRALVAPISNFLRDMRYASKRAWKLKIPWGEEQDEALAAPILALTAPPI